LSSPARRERRTLREAYIEGLSPRIPSALAATAGYLVLTLAMAWPLPAALGRSVAGDYGDPLLVIWIMVRVSEGLTRVLWGDLAAFAAMWDANIFYPVPNTLAYSEHFAGQALLTLPVWWISGNPILIYNAATLASFVLTGLATFALTRAFTGGFAAPFAAGVFAAFNPYRFELELAHLHVLTIQWFPLALLAMHRFVERGSWTWLAALGASLVLMNLSSGYYMLYAAPLVALFGLLALAAQHRLRDPDRWLGLAVAAPAVVLVTSPFILPYLEMQRQTGFVRPMADAIAHSARFEQYATYVLPWAQIPLVLAIAAVAAAALRRGPVTRSAAVAIVGLAILAFALSLGPFIQPWGVRGPYWLLYTYVPGFTGLRVVNRYGALALVLVAVAAGFGASWIASRRRAGPLLVGAATALFIWQVWPARFLMDVPLPSPDLAAPPAYLTPTPDLPVIYREVEALPSDAVLLELPFGDYWYDLRYMFFSATHGRRLVNGYSGFFPPSYLARQNVLARPLLDPDRAAAALAGATHVIVHRAAWPDETGTRIAVWLESLGGRVVAGAGDALIVEMATSERFVSFQLPVVSSKEASLEVALRGPLNR
jgi:hypothetical protein